MSATPLSLSDRSRQPVLAGKLTGDVNIQLHTGDCVSLFNGRSQPGPKAHFTAGLEHYSARTMLVKRYVSHDPVAAEILVDSENRFNQLQAHLLTIKKDLAEELSRFGDALTVESYSSRPVKKSCSGFNPYGMRAVRMLLALDNVILDYRRACHITLITKQEASKHIQELCRRFRSVLYFAFLYKPSVRREDFDSRSDAAKEMLKHYRHVLYIRQNDTRTDEQLCEHYSTYDAEPAYA